MALFIVFIIVFLIGLAWFLLAPVFAGMAINESDAPEIKTVNRIIASVVLGISFIFLLFASLTIVGTHDIGVLTTFGRPDGALSNGLHFKAPWQNVTKLDGRIQTDTYASNGYNGSDQQGAIDGCVNVRIARQATACVNVTIRWQLDQKGVDYLFKNFKTNDNIRDNLLHRDLQTAVNVAFSRYDPLGLDKNGMSTQPSTGELAQQVQTSLDQQVGEWLQIQKVFIPIFNFDPDTQKRLNQLQLQVAQTRIAQQAEQTATAQAAANRALRESVSNDPNVLVSKCLDILAESVQKGMALPAGFSCFGSTGTAVAVK